MSKDGENLVSQGYKEEKEFFAKDPQQVGERSDIVRKRKGGQLKKKKQGYNARKDEQLGMTQGPERTKNMSMKGRRDVAKATRKPKGTYGFS
jgi:hypothetical protein